MLKNSTMSKFTKWLGAGLGFTFGGPIGAILGYAAGSVLDAFTKGDFEAARKQYQEQVRGRTKTQSGDFEISLLILSAVVLKADGKIDNRELDYVRNHFVRMYGKERANHAFKLFNEIVKKKISTRQVCMQIRQHMTHATRLQLLHFLFGVAKSDGIVTEPEVDEIRKISGYLYINSHDFESIKAMFYNSSDAAYTILEISKLATNDEVKKAYRKMAKKYHPDKLQGLGEEHMKGAQEKFQSIQTAYETIKKERGLS